MSDCQTLTLTAENINYHHGIILYIKRITLAMNSNLGHLLL